jgi:gluconate 2-dehydrogenase gamma chain
MRLGLAALDRYTNEQFGEAFVDLTETQQDSIIEAMVDGEATGFEPLSGETLFHVLRRYTAEGMFSDPAYGGNQGLVGWKLIGFPGAQRAYTPSEVVEEGSGLRRQVWAMADLPHFHPGEAVGPNVVLPVTGSEEEYRNR